MGRKDDNILGFGGNDPYNPYAAGTSRLASRLYALCVFFFILFILVASLTPSANSGKVFGEWQKLADQSLMGILSLHNLRDIATNVLLYVPLGVFTSLAVAARRPRIFSLWLFFGTLVSFAIEYGQIFLGRFSDPVDVATNSAGFLLGFLIVAVAVRAAGLNPAALLGIDTGSADTRGKTIAALRFLYICVFWIVALLPFDVSVRAGDIFAKLFPDRWGHVRIIFDPLYHVSGGRFDILPLLLAFLGLLPVAVLRTLHQGLRGRPHLAPAIFSCLLLALLTEAAQIFIVSQTTDIVLLPLAVAAGFTGWIAGRAWIALNHWQGAAAEEGHQTGSGGGPVAVVSLGYLVFLCLVAWSPFDFELSLSAIRHKILQQSNLIPFRSHFADRSVGGALDIIKEAGLFLPLGLLVSVTLARLTGGSRVTAAFVAAVGCVLVAGLLELSQAAVVGRYIDSTDVVMAGGGGIAGAVLSGLFMQRRSR